MAAFILLLSVVFDAMVARNVRDLEIMDDPAVNHLKRYASNNSSATVSRTTSTTFADENARTGVLLRSFRRIRPAGSGDIQTNGDETDEGSNSPGSSGDKSFKKKGSSSYDSYIASIGRASFRNVKHIIDPSARDTYNLQQHHKIDPNLAETQRKPGKARSPLRHLSYENQITISDERSTSPTIQRESPVDDHIGKEIFDITPAETEPNHSTPGFRITGV